MIISYRDSKRNIYKSFTVISDNYYISCVNSINDILKPDRFIDRFKIANNELWNKRKNCEIGMTIAPVLLPDEKTGETMDEYIATQNKLSKIL